MTEISLGLAARPGRSGRTGAAIEFDQISTNNSRNPTGPDQLREQLELNVGDFTSRAQECTGGFVDFLMGRGARRPS
jgi:hypothetical protein